MICEMTVLDTTGDSKTTWDPNQPDEVSAARSTFDRLKGKGYIAYRVNQAGDKGEVMREFDATVGKMILSPPLVGG
jgi:hypothetical protein